MSKPLASLGATLREGSQRGLALSGLAIGVGLLLAGIAAFHAASPPITSVPPGYAALVNQKGVLNSDFMMQTETETQKGFADTTAAERARVLHEMIDEELLVQRGLVLDLPETTTQVREVMSDAVNAQAEAPQLAFQPNDAQLRAFYDQHRGDYTSGGTMTVHDLLLRFGGYQNRDQSQVQAEADATEVVYQLRSGATIEYVMEHFGLADSGRVDNGEQLEFAAKLHLGDKLYQVASALSNGEVSDPVVDTDGVHVLVMDRRQPPEVADFSSVRDKLYTDYRKAESARSRAQDLALLRSQAQILLAPGQTE